MLTRRRLALAIAAAFVPILWVSTTALGGPKPSGSPALLPDLQTAVPHHFTVQNQQQRETLRFSNLIANTGQGDLRLRPEHNITTNITTGFQELLDANGNVVSSQPVSEFVFHPAHNHWHITDVALFEIRHAADTGMDGNFGEVFANQSIKTTFCLIDWIQLEGNSPTGDRNYFECFPDSVQGISGRLGRPVPPRPRRPGAGDHRREAGHLLPGLDANDEGNFIETDQDEQHRLDELPSNARQQGQGKDHRDLTQHLQHLTLCGEELQNR